MAVDTDDTEGVDSATERDIEKVKKAVREAEEPKPRREEAPDDDDDVEIDDETEDDEGGEPTRREKRQNRFREAQERAERAERAAEQLTAQQNQLMQQLIQMQQPRQAEAPVKSFDDSYEEAEMGLISLRQEYAQRQHYYAQAGQPMPDAELKSYIARNRDLEVRKQSVLSDEYVRRNNYQQPDPGRQQAAMELAVVRAQYADVCQSRVAGLHVDYAYKRMLTEGRPDSIHTVQAAFEEARRVVLKRENSTKPTKNQQAKYTGQSTGAGGPARAEGSTGPQRIVMTKDMRKMADQAFPHIQDDKKRWKTWYESKSKVEASRKTQRQS